MIQGKIWNLHSDKALREVEDAPFKILTRLHTFKRQNHRQ